VEACKPGAFQEFGGRASALGETEGRVSESHRGEQQIYQTQATGCTKEAGYAVLKTHVTRGLA